MDALFHIGKEIGEMRADIENLKNSNKKHGNCGKSSVKASPSAAEAANLQTICSNSAHIRKVLQEALDSLNLKTQTGGKFSISTFSLSEKEISRADQPMTCVCCVGGAYACCSEDGCSPICP